MTSFYHSAYFWFSLIYLIIRTLAVSLYSAEINDESKRPVEVFRAIPRESWCLEVTKNDFWHFSALLNKQFQIRRFSEEVNFDVVALSGKKFFFLTRSLVLSVAGTIITYELVSIKKFLKVQGLWIFFFRFWFNLKLMITSQVSEEQLFYYLSLKIVINLFYRLWSMLVECYNNILNFFHSFLFIPLRNANANRKVQQNFI